MSEHVAKNTVYLTVAAVGQKIIAFLYFIFIARALGPESTGQYFLVTSLVTAFSVISDMGVTPVVIREVAKNEENEVRLIRNALGMKVLFTILAIFFTILTSNLLGYDSSLLFLIAFTCVVLLLDSIHLIFWGVLRGKQLIWYESFTMLSGQIITGLTGFIFISIQPQIFWLIFALCAGSGLNVIISSFQILKRFGYHVLVPLFEKDQFRQVFKEALPFAISAIFIKVYSSFDTIMLSKWHTAYIVGVYGVAYKYTYAFQFIPLAFVAALYPGMSSVVTNPDALKRLFLRSMWYMSMVSAPLVFGLWLVAPEIIRLVGESYEDSISVLRVLIFVLIPIFLDFPIGSLLNAGRYQHVKTALMGMTMVINIFLNMLLIPSFGPIGASISSVVSFVAMFIGGVWFIDRILPNFEYIQLFKIVTPIYLSSIVMFIFGILVKGLIGWILVIPLCGIVYVVCLLMVKALRFSDIRRIQDILMKSRI